MKPLTRAQREAVKKYYDREYGELRGSERASYREYRRRVMPTIGCDDAIVIPFCRMWIIVETDGYAHS